MSKRNVDDEIDSGDDEEVELKKKKVEIEIDETAAEKKLRLAKEYISQLKATRDGDVDDEIRDDALEAAGKLFKPSAEHIQQAFDKKQIETRFCKNGHSKTPTAVAYHPDNGSVYSGGKDGTLIRWSVEGNLSKMRRIKTIQGGRKEIEKYTGHKKSILAVAVNTAGTLVASADESGKIIVWNQDLDFFHQFTDHKKAVTGLVFRRQTSQLYSSSVDKTVKVFDLESKSYIETLFGHQDAVQAIDANLKERCITAGGRDNTIRVFKIPEETQLLYRGHHGSIDAIGLLNDEYFVSGGDDGAINFWSAKRKKPIAVIRNAHGGGWITALGTCLNSDCFASGSSDGFLRFWRVTPDRSRIEQFHAMKMEGIINSIKWSSDQRSVVIAIGQENRTGRWIVNKRTRNGIYCIKFAKDLKDSQNDEEDEESSEEETTDDQMST